MKRRDILKYSATTIAGLGLIPGLSMSLQSCGVQDVAEYTGVHMSELDFKNLLAIAETILPETDTPGATTAGVAPFGDLLVGELFENQEKTAFLGAIESINARSMELTGSNFFESDKANQEKALESSDQEAFHRLREFTLWAYFTSEPGMKALNYQPVPGHYDGCTPANSSTKILAGNR